ncbi:zinc finger CCCH domain-containing protein 3 [Amyelois transitella]|uniref:zinc finger CCCH domain-containing protein 3 n=1 Tax=Amyelois transitella TaxID=680683 RepID=UPI00067E25A5|nr:zinc finger CCCH domain-containing protein 3 [Amyelois transitella]
MDNRIYSRVYINPNFNRRIVSQQSAYSNDVEYPSIQNKKIYINPNFITAQTFQYVNQAWKSKEELPPLVHAATVPENPPQIQLPVEKKTRYCLVRHSEKRPLTSKPGKTESLTLKLSKYKSVKITDVKLNLNRAKQPPNQLSTGSKSIQSTSKVYDQQTPREISYNNKAFKTQYSCTKNKQYVKIRTNKHTSPNTTLKNMCKVKIRKLKVKCNIPCRLFSKYGKCLRNARGHCKYLHDKKHVSICRKFLKGICHDHDCLLSHELSDKKMPTCYFYLKGKCTKECCPYLHVKVNEKAILCPDFIKGYCEKGNKCLRRHVNVVKKNLKKSTVDSRSKSLYQVKNKHSEKSKGYNDTEVKNIKTVPPKDPDESTATIDCRYYKEVILDGESNELYQSIKPTRCKLGSLPSFIKLSDD